MTLLALGLVVGLSAAPSPASSAEPAYSSPRRWYQPSASQVAGVAGLVLGNRITPSTTTEMYPGYAVRTAEAWRMKITQRKPIPIAARAPQIVAVSLACSFVTEWGLAVEEHGPLGGLRETQAGRACEFVARSPPGRQVQRTARWLLEACGARNLASKAGELEAALDALEAALKPNPPDDIDDEPAARAAVVVRSCLPRISEKHSNICVWENSSRKARSGARSAPLPLPLPPFDRRDERYAARTPSMLFERAPGGPAALFFAPCCEAWRPPADCS